MKVAFVGKGGSGKTTLSSTIARYIASKKMPVLAIDADINQHLGQSLGLSEEESKQVPAMGLEMTKIKDYLRGNNSLIKQGSDMIKTTPPGTGSRLIRVMEENPIYDHFVKEIGGVRLMAVGSFTEDDLGIRCYHSKTGSVELLLNHLIDKEKEYVLVDMTAGADSFASGLFTRFDITFLVVEPTIKSVSVYKQYREYAKQYDVCIRVIGNKVDDEQDIAFIQEHVGDDLVATFSHSKYIRAMEKGQFLPITEMEKRNKEALDRIISEIDKRTKNWERYYDLAVEFHKKNAESWANEEAGQDLTKQIDSNFSLQKNIATM